MDTHCKKKMIINCDTCDLTKGVLLTRTNSDVLNYQYIAKELLLNGLWIFL